MDRFGRLIASAFARRIAYVLVAAALAWWGIDESKAQTAQTCAYPVGQWQTCDQGRALQECSAGLSRARAAIAGTTGGAIGESCAMFTGANYVGFRCSYKTYAAGSFLPCPQHSSVISAAPISAKCETRPDWNGPYPYRTGGIPKNGSVTCNAGCQQAWYSTGDGYFNGKYTSVPGTCGDMDDGQCKAKFGASYYWNAGMSACEPEEQKCPNGGKANSLGKCEPEPCPEGMAQQPDGTCKKKDNECPAGEIRSPDGKCLPGEGQCAKGETRGKDGTCKKDQDEDGEPDEPGEGEGGEKPPNEFSGGDDCTRPPSCSGDAIMCGQARIQWRIECNTRKNRNIAGGMCSSVPICTGEKCDALEYSQLLMQWRTACAVEKLAGRTADAPGAEGQPEWTKVGGMSTDPGAGSSPNDTKVLTTKSIGIADLDQSGIGGGGSCLGFVSGGGSGGQLASGFLSSMASPPPFFCNYIGWIKAAIILMAAAASAFILARGGQ